MKRIEWGGHAADYTDDEQAFMRSLAEAGEPNEVALVYRIKADLDARIRDDAPVAPRVKACGIDAHAGDGWTNHAGRIVCRVCHPAVAGAERPRPA